jgi:hypothetical protein
MHHCMVKSVRVGLQSIQDVRLTHHQLSEQVLDVAFARIRLLKCVQGLANMVPLLPTVQS